MRWLLVLSVVVLVGPSCGRKANVQAKAVPATTRRAKTEKVSPTRVTVAPERARWIALGGGADPASNQVSLEQDLALAEQVLGPGGIILFAGGARAASVQEARDTDRASLRARLGEFFDPRDSRHARFRVPRVRVQEAAVLAQVRETLRKALGSQNDPLLVFAAAHGQMGEAPAEGSIVLWGGDALTVGDVAELLKVGTRPARFVVAACFAGGFAELAFQDATPEAGPTERDVCGLFATTWDTESTGCDPNPDRAAQDGYSLHFWHALEGKDRDGKPLAPAALDLDADGAISLLEAHTRARIASRSIDVPTTTSERFLRSLNLAATNSPGPAFSEEDAVIRELGNALGLRDGAEAQRELETLDVELTHLNEELEPLEVRTDDTYAALRIALLSRWPNLDDPWHDDFESLLESEGSAIEQALEASREAHALRAAEAALEDPHAQLDEKSLRSVLVERLVRAYETRAFAGSLRRRGGSAWTHYQSLLRCERTVWRR